MSAQKYFLFFEVYLVVHWETGFLCYTKTKFSRGVERKREREREREREKERERERESNSDVPAYARLYLFQTLRTYSILTLGNKSDARIHGYNNTRLLMRALSRFRRSTSPIVPFSRDYYSHYIFLL